MKNKLIFFISLLFCSVSIFAQWVSVGPYSGKTKSLYYDNGTIYTGLDGVPYGIYSSSNGGQAWNPMGALVADVTTMVKVGSVFYAAGRQNGPRVYRTIDNGTTWVFADVGSSNNNMRELTALGTDIFVASDEGIFKSTNSGVNWAQVLSGQINAIVASGTNLVAQANNTYLSTNGGANWITTSGFGGLKLFAAGGNIIYGSHNLPPYGVIVSTNNGVNWSNYNAGLPANDRPSEFALIGSTIFAMLYPNLVYKSTNNGQSWSLVAAMGSSTFPTSIESDGTNLYSSNSNTSVDGGIYKSTNSGVNWAQVGLATYNAGALSSNAGSVYYAGIGFGRSDNNGATWLQTNASISGARKIILDNNNIFVCSGTIHYVSTNNGVNFTTALNTQSFDMINVGGTYFLATFSEVWKSTNGGFNWGSTVPPLTNKRVGQMAFINNHFLAASRSIFDLSYYSTDAGLNWSALSDTTFTAITAMHLLGSVVYAGNSHGIIKSTNNGLNWSYSSSGHPPNGTISKILSSNGVLFSAGSYGVYYSVNSGASWAAYNQGFPSPSPVNDITIKDNFIYAAVSNKSIWKCSLATVGIQTTSNEIPESFYLSQNYPNPFNPMTKIKFDIPSSLSTKITVYDILGKEVKTLVNDKLNPGTYEVDFDGSNLPSGVYFYKLETEAFTETKKMILIK
jgi:hypothetical protein